MAVDMSKVTSKEGAQPARKKERSGKAPSEIIPTEKRKISDLVALLNRAEGLLRKSDGPLHANDIQKKLRLTDTDGRKTYIGMKDDPRFVKTHAAHFDLKDLNPKGTKSRDGKEEEAKEPATA